MTSALDAARQRLASRGAQASALSVEPASGTDAPSGSLRWVPGSTRILSFWNGRASLPAFRVGQLDAESLDHELLELLRTQVVEGLKYLDPHLVEDWADEVRLILQSVLFKLSIWDRDSTYGAAMQGLKLSDGRIPTTYRAPSKWQKAIYGLVTVGGGYGWKKWEDWLSQQENGENAPTARLQQLSRVTSTATTIHYLAAVVSFLAFLINGRYRTITDRLLRLRLIAQNGQITRMVSMEYLNRQLVWHAFTEFLLFLLPLLGIARWRRWLKLIWHRGRSMLRLKGSDNTKPLVGELHFLPKHTCAICYRQRHSDVTTQQEAIAAAPDAGGVKGSIETDITNPFSAIPCGCIYDYTCLVQEIQRQDGIGWTCLRCGSVVSKCKAWDGDAARTLDSTSKLQSGDSG